MAKPTRWTWVWASSGSWRWTGKPGMLQSTEPQGFRHTWATEQIMNVRGLMLPQRSFVVQLLSCVWLSVTPCPKPPRNCSTPDFPVLHYQTQIHWVSDGHPAISSSVSSFSPCPQFFSSLGSFSMSQLCISGGQCIGASVSAPVLPINIQGWFPLWLTGLTFLLSKGLSRDFSSTTGLLGYLLLFLDSFFSIFCFVAVISTILSSRSLICSSVSVILLLILSSVIIHFYLFFRSLVNISCIVSYSISEILYHLHSLSLFWIIFLKGWFI